MVLVAPSLLSADFSKINEWLPLLEEAKTDLFHWDIMDNKYVPNFGNKIEDMRFLRSKTKIFFDSHLMVEKPLEFLEKLKERGNNSVTFHVETVKEPLKAIKTVKDFGFGVGLASNEGVPVEKILPYLEHADIALVMSVQAGFGGQDFLESSLEKVRVLRKKIDEEKLDCKIQIDGGINAETGKKAVEAGVDILVAGSFVFKAKNPEEAVLELKKL